MRKAIIAIIVATAVLCSVTASATQNACQAWNNYASQYHFDTYPQLPTTTFHQAYHGNNFDLDFNAILSQVSQVMNIQSPITGGDDLLNISLENWQSRSTL